MSDRFHDALCHQVSQMKRTMLALITANPERDWSPRSAQGEFRTDPALAGCAFWALVEDGSLSMDTQFRVSVTANEIPTRKRP